MHYRANPERLHAKASIVDAMNAQRRAMNEEIRSIPEARLKAEGAAKVTEALARNYSINMPALDPDNVNPTKSEVDIDVSRDPRRFAGGPRFAKGTEIAISVPYAGDREIFLHHASSHVMSYPRAILTGSDVTFVAQGISLDPAHVRREFDDWIAVIKEHLEGMRKELGNFNDAIKSEIETALAATLAKLKKDDDLLDGLGFNRKPG